MSYGGSYYGGYANGYAQDAYGGAPQGYAAGATDSNGGAAASAAADYSGYYGAQQQTQQQQQQQQQQSYGAYASSYQADPHQQQQQQYADPNAAAGAATPAGVNGGYDYQGTSAEAAAAYQQPAQAYYGDATGAAAPGQGTDASAAASSPLAALNAVDANGLRWTWTTYPNTVKTKAKESASAASIPLPEMVIPLSCMYTPLHPLPLECLVLDDPQGMAPNSGQQVCGNCGAYWSRHSYREERHGGSWVCMSCQRRNQLPVNYSPNHPAMLYDTVEYILPDSAAGTSTDDSDLRHPVFIFVVDTCLPHEEVAAVKTHLLRCLAWLPPRSLVGFIAYGARTTVWELNTAATAGLSKCYALRGDVSYTAEEVPQMLQVSDNRPVRGRFLCPLEECMPVLSALMEELQADGAPQRSNRRPLRTTGTAVGVATFLMESLRQQALNTHVKGSGPPVKTAGKILLFTGGPCTRGLGMVVGTDKAEMMRFHRDIIEGNTPYYEKAHAVYNDLDRRLASVDGCLDVFAQSFDQIGVMEMRHCVNNTGGTFICGDAFDHENFGVSFERYFERCDLRVRAREDGGEQAGESYAVRCAFGVHMEVHTSADTLVSGVLGPSNVDTAANKGKVHRAASPVQIGVGGTTRWCVSSLDQGVSLAFIFDTAVLDSVGGASPAQGQPHRFVQFVTRYVTPTGQRRIRVTSVTQPVPASTVAPNHYVQLQAFDQTCASTIIARMVVSILETYPNRWDDAKRWVDTLLVKFVKRYGTFTPNHAESLHLDPCLSLFPSFMFNLRRSEYFLVLNISPDETTFKRHWLMREPVDNCVLMIQPTLDSYDLEYPYASPVPLDSSSLRHDNIVLMDAFFNVHIMWGNTIYEWIEAKYHELPDYAYFAELLETAESDAQNILARRYPYPRFSRTSANGSEARHVKTRVNPSTTHHQQPAMNYPGGASTGAGEVRSDLIYTDDASISKFMASLKQAVVAPENKGEGMSVGRK